MSSRNQRLTPQHRAAATCIIAGLRTAAASFAAGERDPARLRDLAAQPVIEEPQARLEYLEVVDPSTLEPLETDADVAMIVAAVWFGPVRLIDNIGLGIS